jgi:hypothetical protein
MSRVYVTSHHFEPHSHTLKGLTLHVQFEADLQKSQCWTCLAYLTRSNPQDSGLRFCAWAKP